MDTDTIDALAQEIRRVDGSHSLGAGALAESLAPFIDRLAALPKQECPTFKSVYYAPRNGSQMILRDMHGTCFVGFWNVELHCWFYDIPQNFTPNEYAPLPALPPPPTVDEREGKS